MAKLANYPKAMIRICQSNQKIDCLIPSNYDYNDRLLV